MSDQSKTGRHLLLERAAGVADASVAFSFIVPFSALGLDGAIPQRPSRDGLHGVGLTGQNQLRPFIY